MNPKIISVSPSSFRSSLRPVTECQLWKAVSFHSFHMISQLLLLSSEMPVTSTHSYEDVIQEYKNMYNLYRAS